MCLREREMDIHFVPDYYVLAEDPLVYVQDLTN